MGCAQSIDTEAVKQPQKQQDRKRTVVIKPTQSHLVTVPPTMENPSSGVKTQTMKASATAPVQIKENKNTAGNHAEILAEARDAYNRSDYKQAINLCQGILSKDADSHETYNLLAQVYYWNTQYSKGIECGLKAVSYQPKNAEYWANLAQNYYYAQNYPETIKAYQKSIQISPKNKDYYYNLGRAFYYNYQYEKAIETYQNGIKVKADEYFYFEIGQCFYWLQNYQQGVKALTKSLQINSQYHRAMNHMGLCYYYLSNYQSAEQWYLKALQFSEQNKTYLWNLGRNYYWKQQYEMAIETYERCKKVDTHYQYDLEIAWCYFYLEDYETALKYIEESLKIDNTKAISYFKKGYVYYYKQQYQQSLKWYKKCLDLDPSNFNGLIGVANDYYYMENYPAAIQAYFKCLQNTQNNAQVYERLAKSYYYNQQYQNAIEHFDSCMKLRPKYIQPLILKGRCYFNLGQYQQSYDEFKKAHDLAQSIKKSNPQNYKFYIHTINGQLKAAQEFQIKAKIGVITDQDKQEVQQMRSNFEKKIQKLFTFQINQGFDKKTSKQKPKITLNQDIVEIAKLLFNEEELYHFKNDEGLSQLCEKVKNMFNKDFGYFQIFAYIFEVFVWISKFKKKYTIQAIQKELSEKIRYLSKKNPPTQTKTNVDKSIIFPEYAEQKYNLFQNKHYFQNYQSLVKQIYQVNQQARQDLIPFKQLLFKVQKLSNGHHAKAGMKLPDEEQCKDQIEYQQKLFKVLLRIFEKMFKQLKTKKDQMLQEIEKQINDNKAISIQKIILIMMNKWISYIDNVLKERKQQEKHTQCYITDLVRGKCMFKAVNHIRDAVDNVVDICKQQGYTIMELDNRLEKATQDVVMKIKIKHCVCELQLALQFDLTKFQFGHSFYEIQRCSLGCIFGCSLFLTKQVNETFPELLFDNERITKKSKEVDQKVHPALKFVIKQFMESVKD